MNEVLERVSVDDAGVGDYGGNGEGKIGRLSFKDEDLKEGEGWMRRDGNGSGRSDSRVSER
jgi:hypothetical protein